jgi:hypothetical protein
LVRVNGERMPRGGVGRPSFSWTPRGSEKTDAG